MDRESSVENFGLNSFDSVQLGETLHYAEYLFLPVKNLFCIALEPTSGLPQSGKNIWKMKFFPGQGKVREFCGWSGKFRKDLEGQGKVREFENKWLWQADFRKFIYTVQEGKDVLFHETV